MRTTKAGIGKREGAHPNPIHRKVRDEWGTRHPAKPWWNPTQAKRRLEWGTRRESIATITSVGSIAHPSKASQTVNTIARVPLVRADCAYYSHSIVPGGFEVTSYTTRFTPRTSFTMRFEMVFSTSYGSGTQSAVIPSSE
jgi:hypothetical protein